jgi:hypothetical protein
MRGFTGIVIMALMGLAACVPLAPPGSAGDPGPGDGGTPAPIAHAATDRFPPGRQMGVYDASYASVYPDYPFGTGVCGMAPYYPYPFSPCFAALFHAEPFFFGFGAVVAINQPHHPLFRHPVLRARVIMAGLRGKRR